jgi:hypothetical protein
MRATRTSPFIALVLFAALLLPAASQAQIFRAYLASDGSDANPCTLPLPCRLLPAALAAVTSGGEIWMLDSANFNSGPVTIAKSVSILAVPGAVGSVVALGGSAIVVPFPGLKVALRNLVIVPVVGGPGGATGVEVTAASSVTIEGSLIANMLMHGVQVLGGGTLVVTDSTIRNNAQHGISLGCGTSAEIVGTKLIQHNVGLNAFCDSAATTSASLVDSAVIGGAEGIVAWANAPGASVKVFVTRSSILRNSFGLDVLAEVGSTALIALSYSMVTNNNTGWYINGGGTPTIRSLVNNHMTDNGASTGSLTAAALQ